MKRLGLVSYLYSESISVDSVTVDECRRDFHPLSTSMIPMTCHGADVFGLFYKAVPITRPLILSKGTGKWNQHVKERSRIRHAPVPNSNPNSLGVWGWSMSLGLVWIWLRAQTPKLFGFEFGIGLESQIRLTFYASIFLGYIHIYNVQVISCLFSYIRKKSFAHLLDS